LFSLSPQEENKDERNEIIAVAIVSQHIMLCSKIYHSYV